MEKMQNVVRNRSKNSSRSSSTSTQKTPIIVRQPSTPAVNVNDLPQPKNIVEKAVYSILQEQHGAAAGMLASRFDASLRSLAAMAAPLSDSKVSSVGVKAFVDHVATHFLTVLQEAIGGKVRSCAELMHRRSVCCGNVLHKDVTQQCLTAINSYLRLGVDQDRSLRSIAKSFADYLSTHSLDPDNALVGQKASPNALKQLLGADAVGELLLKRDAEELLSRQHLLDQIASWGNATHKTILDQAKQLHATYQNMWHAGDIIVVFMERDKYVYARFSGKRVGAKLLVFISPDETEFHAVSTQQCFPLTMGFDLNSSRAFFSMTVSPIGVHCKEASAETHASLLELLEESDVDVELLHRIIEGASNVDVSDMFVLRRTQHALKSLHSSERLQTWLNDQKTLLEKKAGKFMSTLEVDSVLAPFRMRQLRDFASFPTEQTQALSSKLAGFVQLTDDAHKHVLRRADFLLRGQIKAELTTWWLGVIREKVEDLLHRIGYKENVIPEDCNQKPDNMDDVLWNKRLLDECLDKTQDKHKFYVLLKQLTAEIYPRIDRFLLEATAVIAAVCGVNVPPPPARLPKLSHVIAAANDLNKPEQLSNCVQHGGFSLRADGNDDRVGLTSSTSSKIQKLSPQEIIDEIKALASDLEYIRKMVAKEKGEDIDDRNVTPISGIAVGRLVRASVSLRSVIDMFGTEAQKKQSAASEAPSAVVGTAHRAQELSTQFSQSLTGSPRNSIRAAVEEATTEDVSVRFRFSKRISTPIDKVELIDVTPPPPASAAETNTPDTTTQQQKTLSPRSKLHLRPRSPAPTPSSQQKKGSRIYSRQASAKLFGSIKSRIKSQMFSESTELSSARTEVGTADIGGGVGNSDDEEDDLNLSVSESISAELVKASQTVSDQIALRTSMARSPTHDFFNTGSLLLDHQGNLNESTTNTRARGVSPPPPAKLSASLSAVPHLKRTEHKAHLNQSLPRLQQMSDVELTTALTTSQSVSTHEDESNTLDEYATRPLPVPETSGSANELGDLPVLPPTNN